jgi:hypothetical protein
LRQLAKSRFTAAIDNKTELLSFHPSGQKVCPERAVVTANLPAADRSLADGLFPSELAVPWPDVIADAVWEAQRFFDVVSQANSAGCARIELLLLRA